MRFAGGRLVVFLCLIFCSALPAAAQLTATCSPQCYGPGLGSDGLANTTVGPNGNMVSYRFRAGHSGILGKIHIYLIPDRTGYAAGTGGKIQITVNTDDDTAAHNPSTTVLASYLLADPLAATPSRYFPIITFAAPPSLVAGRLYHIVFKNVDASPSVNYLSVDALYLAHPTTPAQPTISDIDGAELLRTASQAWQPRKGYLPILQLDFSDGWTEGIGYMEVWIGAPQAISGTNAVREQLTVGGAQKDVSKIAVRVARTSGSDPLKVRLQDANGTLIEEGSIPAASFPLTTSLSYVWAEYRFTSIRTLLPGKTYFVELAAASTSAYQAFPVRKGGSYNFANTTYFPEGFAQFKQGSTWTGWTQWGVTNRLDSDLQFYFEVATVGATPAISNVSATTTATGATVTWTTDQASNSQIEYGLTSSYGSTTALNSALVTSHSQAIAGLTPGTQYHYRVRSTPSAGALAVSSDFTFTTDTVPPVISSVATRSITSSSSIVSWSTDQAADGQVEYGTSTAYGSSTTFNPTMAATHAQTLSGLSAGTLYHYRVRSGNDSGDVAFSGDGSFTTLSVPPVIVNVASTSIAASTAVVSWSTDQATDGQVDYGTTTAYGSSTTLNPTMATSHAQALSSLTWGTVYHYRVRSTNSWGDETISGDGSFTTTTLAPVISSVAAGSITSSAATVSWATDQAASGQVDYGTTTAYGNSTAHNPTMATSHAQALNGLAWGTVYHYRVRSTNSWGDPAVSNDATFTTATVPPVISSVATGSITSNAATVSWATDQAANGQVDYGTTTAYGNLTTLNPTMATSHAQALSGLTWGTLYHYRVRSTNSWGDETISGDGSFTTTTLAPVISSVAAGSITSSAATVSWATDQAASGQVDYGTTTAYGNSTTLNPTMATSHAQALSGLTWGTLYHYRVRSTNSWGDPAVSNDVTFTTATVPPVISSVATGSITSSAATVSWATDQAASGQVDYGTTTAYGNSTTLNLTMATSHAQALSGLSWGTLYHYRVRSTNSWGDPAVTNDATFTTATVPPVISSVTAGSITATGATIGWTTDQSSTSQVEYGTSTAYGTSTSLDIAMVTSHTHTLPSLTAGTVYHYRVRSTNASGNLAMSGDTTFTTASVPVVPISTVSCSAGCYGAGLAADALSSAIVGGAAGNVVSYRFRAKHAGSLDRIHFYMLPNVAGYSGGTGGTIQITVNADDGTPAHNPSAAVLASYLLSNPVAATPSKYFPIISFPASPALTVGQLYHVVFANIDASPSVNYLSISSLYQPSAPTPAQPSVSDTDGAQLLRTGGGSWALRKGYTPILQIDYKDGASEGIGYMEVWVGAPRSISGTNAVRETFTVTGAQKIVKSVAVRVARLSGGDAMTLRLEDGAGNLIEERDIPASSVPSTSPVSYTWVGFAFSSPRTLVPGQTYHLVLQSASSSSYQAYPIRKGSAYSFQSTTYFPDGYAQFKATTLWTGWTQWGVADRTDSDLQFYFGF